MAGSKCRVCRGPAIIDLPRHNANFCGEHLEQLCRRQVEAAIDDFSMFGRDDRLLVAVSGGKDSLAVWDLLVELGYRADGLYVGLGIGSYSDVSASYVDAFVESRGLHLITVDLRQRYGFDVPTAAKNTNRPPCSSCGLSKRHIFDEVAAEHGYDAVVTGHNLDDEAAVLFGNTLRWDIDYLARQYPVLPARAGMPRKAKPLVRLTERETAAWCIVRGIDYQVDECPMAVGNRHLRYKQALNQIERDAPGSKASFYLGFVNRMAPILRANHLVEAEELNRCATCGAPTTNERCAFCALVDRVGGLDPVPVELVLNKAARAAYLAESTERS